MLLLIAVFAAAQQPTTPPGSTPPTFPQEDQQDLPAAPNDRMPPDTPAPAHEIPNDELQAQIQDEMAAQPGLTESVNVIVNDEAIVLTGTVDNEQQHELALRIASNYAGDREVIDKIEMVGRT
jgi:hypothetical protein